MSASTQLLAVLAAVTAAGLLVGDWRRRTGRGAPLSRVRTAIRRRIAAGTDAHTANSLLAAGFAAQVIGPLLALASAAARRADTAKARLERRLDEENAERSEHVAFVSNLGAAHDGVRPTGARWHRYMFYASVIVIDIATGLVIARGLNLSTREGFGFGASAGLFLFFIGKIGGTGLRRLDLGKPRTSGAGPSHPDIGKPWVSVAMIALSIAGIVVFIAGMTASRQVAQAITTTATNTAAAAAGQPTGTAVSLPPVPWWQSALSSGVALGSFTATVFMAMRSHPITRRIEELEIRMTRRARRALRAIKPLGTALEASARNLALLDVGLAELTARLELTEPLATHPAFASVCAAANDLHQRHDMCITTLDNATNIEPNQAARKDKSSTSTPAEPARPASTPDPVPAAAASSNGSHR